MAAIKPQLAFFEARGLEGMAALVEVLRFARGLGLIIIADAKRGDIGSTSAAYAEAFLGDGDFGCDAVTVNPYLGSDAMAPFVARVRNGRGVFVLVKTSNPSSGEFQDLNAAGRPVWEAVAGRVDGWGSDFIGQCGLSSVGAVIGATYPEQAARARALMPAAIVAGAGLWGAGRERARRGRVGPRGRTRGDRQCQPRLDVCVCVLARPVAAGGSAPGRGGDARGAESRVAFAPKPIAAARHSARFRQLLGEKSSNQNCPKLTSFDSVWPKLALTLPFLSGYKRIASN